MIRVNAIKTLARFSYPTFVPERRNPASLLNQALKTRLDDEDSIFASTRFEGCSRRLPHSDPAELIWNNM
jgi:hypothetical protein